MQTKWRNVLRFALIAVAVLGSVWLSGVRLFAFSGKSMEPTVMAGDYFVGLVGIWGTRAPERFDMVIFDVPPTSKWAERKIPWMKRLVGLPGERICLVGDRLFIDGREESAHFLHRDLEPTRSGDLEVLLRADEYFVLGDNLDHSLEDSRVLGPIPAALMKGRVAFVISRGKEQRPNQSVQPTPGSVTPRASSPISK
jgi:signal peptidase I